MPQYRLYNKNTGTTYVYETENYYDSEKKETRNRKKLIGKIDPETGDIIPTGKRGPVAKAKADADADVPVYTAAEYNELQEKNRKLLGELEAKEKARAALDKELKETKRKYREFRMQMRENLMGICNGIKAND
ncbi:MAG: hypothetical protein LUD48_00210 [Prevotella sp.]|nr:hypothetical protein [Prevotella sp.]